ncbi:MAG: transcription factor S [Candidatus Nanoarchaeia archaeon]
MFCPKCKSIMLPKKGAKKGTVLVCSNCGYKTKGKEAGVIKEKVSLDRKDQIEIIDKKIETLPKTREECPNCGNMEAFFWTVQTRAGDEAETRFFECTKCKHRWRAYN